jgi:hypothetical protein
VGVADFVGRMTLPALAGEGMKKSVCYVDDDQDEIRRFRKFMGDRYIVGAGVTLDDALQELEESRVRKPDLFLLDLYYGPETLPQKRDEIAAADERLSKDEDDFRRLMVASGQSPDAGFNLAAEAQRRYPSTVRALFSRKAFLQDALRAHEMNLPLLEKPDPDTNNADANDEGATTSDRLDEAFRRHADQIAKSLDRIVNLNTWWVRNRQRVEGFSTGFFFFVLKISWDLWKSSSPNAIQTAMVGALIGAAVAIFAFAWLAKRS